MMDDAPNPVALDYAPPQRPRHWWVLPLILSGAHLVVSVVLALAWYQSPGPMLEKLCYVVLCPILLAYGFGWLEGLPSGAILLVLVPLNSVSYGSALAAAVLIVRRIRR